MNANEESRDSLIPQTEGEEFESTPKIEENNDNGTKTQKKIGLLDRLPFLKDLIGGFFMGIAFIIPGFSGGSVAAILGIYERLIGAVADIFKSFRRSLITLLPIFIGLVLGAVSLLYPLGWALESFPLPTVSLFVGLALGGLGSITDKTRGRPTLTNIVALAIPLLLALALSFAPTGADVDLLGLNAGGYLLLFVIGFIGSVALVVPGISGSMILLILGYYNPIIKIITEHFLKGQDMPVAFLVLMCVGLGILVGFFAVSVVMKWLLAHCPRGTYFAIIGFIIGSVPTVFISTAKDVGMTLATLPQSPLYWIACVLLLALGFIGAFLFVRAAKRSEGK